MATLNFKHLRYFWTVAKSGSIARASAQLHVTPQSISGQLGELESSLGTALFRRAGRGLELTDVGRRILSYAEEIFTLGDELIEVVRGETDHAALPFRVGIADSVPKLLSYRVVAPSAIAPYVCRQYEVETVGRIVTVVEHLYGITTERRLRHPATVAVSEAAAREVFGEPEGSAADPRPGAPSAGRRGPP